MRRGLLNTWPVREQAANRGESLDAAWRRRDFWAVHDLACELLYLHTRVDPPAWARALAVVEGLA